MVDIKNLYIKAVPLWLKVLIGLLAGGLFILLNKIDPAITIGIPSVFATAGERAITTNFLAPVGEELLFGFAAVYIIHSLVDKYISKNIYVKWAITILIVAPLFSIFHATAYAGSLSAQNIAATQGLFLGAILFRTFALILIAYFGLIPAIIFHGVLNYYLTSLQFVIIATIFLIKKEWFMDKKAFINDIKLFIKNISNVARSLGSAVNGFLTILSKRWTNLDKILKHYLKITGGYNGE